MTPQAAASQTDDEVYELLRLAILRRQPITAVYDGHPRSLCPHVLGRKAGRLRVFCFQFEGSSSSQAGEAAGWRCLAVDKLRQVQWCEASWHTGPQSGQQMCVDAIDFDIATQEGPVHQ
jgi:hypothetical protein